jgi:sulfur carrier protein ThiS
MKKLPIILVLLLAFALRSWELTAVPPGLTHDEANHGREAIGILNGVLLFYFPLNYGSEPLYSYIVAVLMGLIGEHLFALRLVNVYFGLGVIAALYAWARRQLDRQTAVLAAALLAVSFWPLATSRQALRAGILPFLMVAAVIFFWQIIHYSRPESAAAKGPRRAMIGFALAVAATIHTYLAARVLWLTFPLFLLYWLIWQRARWRAWWRPLWRRAVAGLLFAGLLVTPMFLYLRFNPQAQTRLQMLDGPIQALRDGNPLPVIQNGLSAVLALFVSGYGDHFLAYNIPGRPVLDLVTALFLGIGILVCLWRWRQPVYPFALLWLLAGLLPSLITGPEANTTRNLGALPVLYLLPALGFTAVWQQFRHRWPTASPRLGGIMALLWLSFVAVQSSQAYFHSWAQSPDVRAAYQSTLMSGLTYLQNEPIDGPVVVSSVYPGVAHDPSIALVMMGAEAANLRWVDGRLALIFPHGQTAYLLHPAATPLHPLFEPLLQPIVQVNQQPGDLDPYFTVSQLLPAAGLPAGSLANFNGGLLLVTAHWQANPVRPGDVIELVTTWRVTNTALLGPLTPPLDVTELVLFTHLLLDESGAILTQADRLDAPSWSWHTGDLIMQIHQMYLPPDTPPGSYETVVGVYDRHSGNRLPLLNQAGDVVDSRAFVVSLTVE